MFTVDFGKVLQVDGVLMVGSMGHKVIFGFCEELANGGVCSEFTMNVGDTYGETTETPSVLYAHNFRCVVGVCQKHARYFQIRAIDHSVDLDIGGVYPMVMCEDRPN
jgi:hypothetical protein